MGICVSWFLIKLAGLIRSNIRMSPKNYSCTCSCCFWGSSLCTCTFWLKWLKTFLCCCFSFFFPSHPLLGFSHTLWLLSVWLPLSTLCRLCPLPFSPENPCGRGFEKSIEIKHLVGWDLKQDMDNGSINSASWNN